MLVMPFWHIFNYHHIKLLLKCKQRNVILKELHLNERHPTTHQPFRNPFQIWRVESALGIDRTIPGEWVRVRFERWMRKLHVRVYDSVVARWPSRKLIIVLVGQCKTSHNLRTKCMYRTNRYLCVRIYTRRKQVNKCNNSWNTNLEQCHILDI